MRQIILDTETTGLDPNHHRIIEIGCVELIDRKLTRRHFHVYLNPERVVEEEAIAIHGLTNEFLADKPLFASVVEDFLAFVADAELVIHNAPFDIGFINAELKRLKRPLITPMCGVLDTLALARKKHPGQKNNLDALCKRYGVDNTHRDLHGALLDAEILADVYLLMTGGQTSLELRDEKVGSEQTTQHQVDHLVQLNQNRVPNYLYACDDELLRHQAKLSAIDKLSSGQCLWLKQMAESKVTT